MQPLASFTSELFKPCRKFLRFLRLLCRRPISIRVLRCRNLRKSGEKKHHHWRRRLRFGSLRRLFRQTRRPEEMDRIGELKSMTERDWSAPCPSPLTPAYVKLAGARRREAATGGSDVEEACRCFENYLVEMIVGDGKVRDLTDVEELLYCWNRLKSPVYIDLVCRFYVDLCKDLFSDKEHEVVEAMT